MTVYNRKMFRKKGGGATGIMASGPELMKRFNGGGVNVPGGGSTLARSGFPSLRAFGGLGQTIPSQFQMPTLEDIIGAGGQPTNTRARGNISARSLNPKTTVDRPRAVQVPDYDRGIVDIIRGEKFGGTQFGRDAVKQMSKTERDIYNQMGPFRGRDLTASEKLDDNVGESSSESAIKQGFRSLGDGVNTSINNILNKAKIDETPFDLEGDEAFDDSTAIEQEKEGLVKKVQPKVIGGGDDRTKPSSVNDLDTMLTKVFGENKTKDTTKGAGAENKGGGKASLAGEATKDAYKKTNKLIQGYVDKGDSENATNTQLMQAGFKKSDVENMSPAEKVAEVKNIIKEVMGSEDTGPDDDLNAMNTIMLGLSIAAGDSPDALTNVIKGSKDYAERRMKNLKEKKDREEKLDLLALTTVLNREDKEDDRNFIREKQANSQKHDMRLFAAKSAFQMEQQLASFNFKELINKENNLVKLQLDANQTERFTLGLKSTMAQTIAKIKSNEAIANSSNALKADIANAQAENQLLRTTLSNLPDGYAFAMQEGLKNNLTGDALFNYAKEKGALFAKSNIFTGPDSLRRMVINVAPKVMKEQNMNFNEAVNHIVDSVSANQTLLQAFPEITKFKNTIASPTTSTLNTADSKILDQRNIKVGDSFLSGGKTYKRTADNKIELVGG